MLSDGEYRTVCAADCPDSCGLLATCRNGQLVQLEGRPDNPYTRGFICLKGRRWVQALRGPERLTTPLVRQGDSFMPLSWDEAMARAADAIQRAARRSHQSFLFYEGSGNILLGNDLQRLLPRLLGGGTMATGSLCGVEGKVGLARSYGTVGRDSPLVVLKSASILLWGRNPAVTSPHFMALLQQARRNGARLATIDVRRTPTTAAGDAAWIVQPGSDLLLARYLCRRVIEERGEPTAPALGFAVFREACREIRSEEVLQATGLNAVSLEALVSFLTARQPLSIWTGYGLQRTAGGAEIVQTIDALGFLLGTHRLPGGGVWFDQDEDRLLPADFAVVPGAQTRFLPRPNLGAALLAADPPVEAAMIVRGNPVAQCPDAGNVRRFLAQCPFSVCLDWCMSATARACSMVLPVTLPLERRGDYVMSYFHDLLQKTAQVCDPPAGARDELAIVRELAQRLGLPEEPFTREQARLAALEQDPRLIPLGPGVWRLQEQPRVQGAFHFPLPTPRPPEAPGMLHLITVHGPEAINSTGTVPAGPVTARISPALAAALHLCEGQRALARNGQGSLPVRIHLEEQVAPGTVVLPAGQEGVNQLVIPRCTAHGNSCINDTLIQLIPEEER